MPQFRAKLILSVTAVGLALCAIACFQLTPRPSNLEAPRLGNTFDDLKEPKQVYEFRGTSVWIAKVDVMSLEPSLNLTGITFSTKENLAPPFRNHSIDGLIWNELCGCKVEDGCKSSYGEDRHTLWQRERASLSPDEPWAIAMPPHWQGQVTKRLKWPTAYFTAGIAAQQDGNTHTTPEKVTQGVIKVCSLAHGDGISHLGLPILGAGAAIAGAKDKKMDLEMAIRAVLEGVNKSADNEECPDRITLLLFPGVKSAAGIKAGIAANDGAEEAKWLETGNALHAAITDGDSVMHAPSPWSGRKWLIVSWQVLSIASCVLVSAVFACHVGVRLTLASIIQNVVSFIFVALGVQLGTTAIAIKPAAPSAYGLLMVAALIVPVWRWKKFGDVPETSDAQPEPTEALPGRPTIVPSTQPSHDVSDLIERIDSLSENKSNSSMQRLVSDSLELVCFPMIYNPVLEQKIDSTRRCDIVFDVAPDRFIGKLTHQHKIPSLYLFVECKDSINSDVGNPEFDRIASRFSPRRGMFGLLVARKIHDRKRAINQARTAMKNGRGLVIPWDLSDIRKLLVLYQEKDADSIMRFIQDAIRNVVL